MINWFLIWCAGWGMCVCVYVCGQKCLCDSEWWWCVVFVVVSDAGVCMSVAVTAILADEINDQLSLQMVLLFVGVCVC